MTTARPDRALLAALDAELVRPDDPAATRAVADPGAAAVLAALAATRSDLGVLRRPPMPDALRARLRAVGEAADPAATHRAGTVPATRPASTPGVVVAGDEVPPGDDGDAAGPSRGDVLGVASHDTGHTAIGPATVSVPAVVPDPAGRSRPRSTPGRRGSRRPRPPILAARRPGTGRSGGAGRRVVVAALAAGLLVAGGGSVVATLDADPRPTPLRILALRLDDLSRAGASALAAPDPGPLADPATRAACLRAAGVTGPAEPLLGARQVVLDEVPGVLLVLPSGTLGRFRLLVVDSGCGPGGGRVLADRTVDAQPP